MKSNTVFRFIFAGLACSALFAIALLTVKMNFAAYPQTVLVVKIFIIILMSITSSVLAIALASKILRT